MTSQHGIHLQVAAIKNGTVIDHIAAGSALKIIRLLNLPSQKTLVTVGLNLPSKKMGHKDLIKVEGRTLTQAEANEVALFAPHASVNIIHNYSIVKKFNITLPQSIERVAVCPNSKCITNHEAMSSRFATALMGDMVQLTCCYCGKAYGREDISEYRI